MLDSDILESEYFHVQAPCSGGRADQWVLELLRSSDPCLKELSRNRLKSLFLEGLISISGKKARASDFLPEGSYELTLPSPKYQELKKSMHAQALSWTSSARLPVLYEDAELLVLRKPSGLASIPLGPNETQTAVGAALAYLPSLQGIGKGGLEPGIIHRLDTATSGCLAFAKTQAEYERLKILWNQKHVRKTYLALCLADLNDAIPVLKAPVELHWMIGHDLSSAKKMCVVSPSQKITLSEVSQANRPSENKITTERKVAARGKAQPSITRILRTQKISAAQLHAIPELKRLSGETGQSILEFEIEIQTGVMHQIRVTLAHLGFPIIGDSIYRGKKATRLYLHAWKLELPQASGKRLLVVADPEDWT